MAVPKAIDIALSWFLFAFYAVRAIGYTIAEVAAATYNFLMNFVLGAAGKVFIFFMMLAVLGAVNTKTQADVDSSIATVYVETAPSRQLVYDGIQLAVPLSEPLICLNNLVASWSTVALQTFLKYVFECGNLKAFLFDLKDFISVALESVLKFIFLDNGLFGNSFDFQSIFKAYAKLLSNFDPVAECLCEDLIPVYNFTRDVISEDNLGCLIGQASNSAVELAQESFKTILFIVEAVVTLGQSVAEDPYEPQLLYFDTLCLASECGANWIDFILGKFFGFFVEDPPQIGVGCVLGELTCTGLAAVKLVLLNLIGLFWRTEEWNPFTDSNFTSVIYHMNNTGKCVQTLLTPIDSCFGEASGNAVRFTADLLYFVVQLIQQGVFEIEILSQSLNRFLGQSTFGTGSHVGRIGSHEKSVKQNQTSLTCMIARISKLTTATDPDFERCNVAIADLANSVGQLFLLPLDFTGVAIGESSLLTNIKGNPLQESTRDDFETYFTLLLDSISDRAFGLADYLAHTFGCVDALKPFGKGLVVLVGNIRVVFTDIQDIFILFLEVAVQSVIVIITLFAGAIFPNDTFANELSIFGQILLDVFLKLLELILNIVEKIINLTIAFFFPALFGQETLYEDPDAPATFTACISDFVPDCICGLVYQLVKDICLPLDIGCLGELLPGCGIFQTNPTDIIPSTNPEVQTTWLTQSNRRRSYTTWEERPIVNMTGKYNSIFEYFAGEFNSGFCGDIFMRYKNYDPTTGPAIGEIDAAIFMACLGIVKSSVIFAADSNDEVHPRYLMDSGRYFNSSKEFIKGATIASLTGITNFGRYSRMPEPSIGKLSLAKPIYLTVEDELKRHNISDPLAVSYLKSISDITLTGYTTFMDTFDNTSQVDQNGTIRALYDLGTLSYKGLSTVFMAGKIIGAELNTNEIATHMSTGFTSIRSSLWTSIDWESVEATLSPKRKRHHDEELRRPWFPNITADNATAMSDEERGITKADISYYYAKKAKLAARAYGGLLAGPYLEALSRRNMNEAETKNMSLLKFGQPKFDINRGPYEHVAPYHRIEERGFYGFSNNNRKRGVFSEENAAATPGEYLYLDVDNPNIHTNVSYIYGTDGLIDFEDHIPNSCGQLHMFCDGPLLTGCDSIEYIETLGLCQPFFGDRGVVIECGDGFAGLAIYPDNACKGIPRIVTTNSSIPGADRGCITFAVAPNGPKNNFFCIRSNECTACPVDKVLPNFECAYADEVVHRMKWLTQRCLVKFIGAIKPPFNFTNIIPQPTDPFLFEFSGNRSTATSTLEEQTNTTCVRSKCGDGIISDEIYRIYTNRTHYVERRCEQCDDKNRRSYDGCSSSCQLERCPTYIYNARRCTPPYYDPLDIEFYTKVPTPKFCFTDGVTSIQSNCKAFDPVSFTFANAGCKPPILNTFYYYNDTCNVGCTGYNSNGVCLRTIASSKEARCGEFCTVCGDGIVSGTEACDDDPWFGNTCVNCQYKPLPCNTTYQVCSGICRGGSLDGSFCQLRSTLPDLCGDAAGTCLIQYAYPPSLPPAAEYFCGTVKCEREKDSPFSLPNDYQLEFNETIFGICGGLLNTNADGLEWANEKVIGARTGFNYDLFELINANSPYVISCETNTIRYRFGNTLTIKDMPFNSLFSWQISDLELRGYWGTPDTGVEINDWSCITIGLNFSCPENITNPYLSRKRSVDVTPEITIDGQSLFDRLDLFQKMSILDISQADRYVQRKRSIETAEPIPVVKRNVISQPQIVSKSSWMETWYYDTFHDVYNFFTGSSGNTLDSKVNEVKDFFTNVNLEPYRDVDHGIWYYVTFPAICHNPENLDSSLGYGLTEGIVISITYFAIVMIVLTFTTESFPAIFVQLLMIVGLQLFLGLTFGYSLKCAFSTPPRLPEKLVEEIGDLAAVFNKTCIGFMQPVMTTPCLPDEEQIALSCKDVGFVDGFDTIVAMVEFYFPASASTWIRTSDTVAKIRSGISFVSWFNGYELIESYDTSLANFNLNGSEPSALQKYCFWRTLPMITQPFPFIFLGGFISLAFIGVYRVLAESIFWMFYAGMRALTAIFSGSEIDPFEERRMVDEEQRLRQRTYAPPKDIKQT